MLDRDSIVSALEAALKPLDWVHAAWLGGSAAFGRQDGFSDVDMQLVVDDDRVEDGFAAAEAALSALSPIALTYPMPMPTWHGHAQRFYQLRDATPFHMVDLLVQTLSSTNRFTERERHGEPVVLFDKRHLLAAPPVDREAFRRMLEGRVADLEARFPMFQNLVEKETLRGDALAALHFYQSLTLRPLVELLRIRHDPYRHDFGLRYIQHDLPAPLAEAVTELAYVGAIDEIPGKRERAEQLFNETLADLKARGIQLPEPVRP
jgi:predicted nucleotidyltransferase